MKRTNRLLSAILSVLFFFCLISCNNVNSESKGEERNVSILVEKKYYSFILNENEQPEQILAFVLENGEKVENPEITYEVKNSDVCEVNEGLITPISAGKSEVVLSYGNATALIYVSVSGVTTEENVNTFDEKYVNRYGRTYIKDGKLCLDHVSTGVEVAIEGTRLTAQIETTADLYLCIFVDGEDEYSSRIKVERSTTNYFIVKDLEEGFHTIRIVKSNEIGDGQIKIVSFRAKKFYTAPEKSSLRIEFIGDSLTAGYGALGKTGTARTVENSDGCSSFAYRTAKMLNADYSVVAIQGICVKAYYWQNISMSEVYPLVSTISNEKYAFDFQPDIVVVNLGTNDSGYVAAKDSAYILQFANDYCELLSFIRKKYKNAYIVCMNGFMGRAISDEIDVAIETINDKKIIKAGGEYVLDALGANAHPCKDAQYKWADELSAFISENLL